MGRTILIYSHGEIIGDGLIKLPALAAARAAFAGDHLTWCAAKGASVYATVLKEIAAPLLDEILIGPPPLGRRFDVVVDTQKQVASSLRARLAARRVFVSAALGYALSTRRPSDPEPEAMASQVARLIGLAAGQAAPLRGVPMLDARAQEAARALLAPGQSYIGLAPGAGGRARRWPLENFLALAKHVTALGRTPVFLLGPEERDMEAIIRAGAPQALLPELDRRDAFGDVKGPRLVIALAGRLDAAIANDSGPGHMLAAGGAPLVSLQQDARKARKFPPAAPRVRLVIASDYGDAGMSALPVEAARAALDELLAQGAGACT